MPFAVDEQAVDDRISDRRIPLDHDVAGLKGLRMKDLEALTGKTPLTFVAEMDQHVLPANEQQSAGIRRSVKFLRLLYPGGDRPRLDDAGIGADRMRSQRNCRKNKEFGILHRRPSRAHICCFRAV